jgi:hypothetical protein
MNHPGKINRDILGITGGQGSGAAGYKKEQDQKKR